MNIRLTESNIAECQAKFNLSYHVHFARICQDLVGFESKDVLEVGGSLPPEFVFDYLHVKSWSAIETPDYEESLKEAGGLSHTGTIIPNIKDTSNLGFDNRKLEKYNFFLENIENLPQEYYGKYDLIFSIATFEHIHKLPAALDKMFLALKPGGKLFSMFSPIWSAYDGHHLPKITDQTGQVFDFGNSPIPPWGHLLMKPNELCRYLYQYTDKETAELMVDYVYNSPHINRYFTEDYLEIIKGSKFQSKRIELIFKNPIDEKTQENLENLYPVRKLFKNNGLLVLLEKLENYQIQNNMTDSYKSPLDRIIPAEIKNDEFYVAVEKITRQEDIQTVLEIGSSSGEGSTEALVKGISANSNNPTLFCIEVSQTRFKQLKKRYQHQSFVKAYNVSSVEIDAIPKEQEVIYFYQNYQTGLNNYPLETVLKWLSEGREYLIKTGLTENGITTIKQENKIDGFDAVLIDGSEFTGSLELDQVLGAKYIMLDDINTFKNYKSHRRLLADANYNLVAKNLFVRNGYSIFKRNEQKIVSQDLDLPIHFFTIVLNGQPFIRYHIDIFKQLPFKWHWHIIEGVADLKHDTGWSLQLGGKITDEIHKQGRSKDGTSEYLDELAAKYPENITLYRKPEGEFWDGKREMVNAPLRNIKEECLLWQVDVDEIWTLEQICNSRKLFIKNPEKTAAFYWCWYFVGENLVISSRNCYTQNPKQDWLRTWRFKPGYLWAAHEPPVLVENLPDDQQKNIAAINPFRHVETEKEGLIFQHFAYITPEQLKNAILFFRAFAQFHSKQGFEIVCTGTGVTLANEYREYASGSIVHSLMLSDEELTVAYSGAVALVYPSLYDGFGMPVVEALACACPVITCANASIPEVAGEAAIYVEANDVDGLTDALCEVQKLKVRNSLITAGLEQAKKFSWGKMADIMSTALMKATLGHLNLRDINLIIFPDWRQAEETVGLELQKVIKNLVTHPDRGKMTLLIDNSNIIAEDADLILSSVAMNLLMEEELEIDEGPEIVLVGELSQVQWSALIPRLQGRIKLEHENGEAIAQLKAENIPVIELNNLSEKNHSFQTKE